jgi:hypothetical protein
LLSPIDQLDAELRVILKGSLVASHCYHVRRRRNLGEECEPD